jgi:glutamine synthetase
MLSMNQSRTILSKAGVKCLSIVPGSGSHLHISVFADGQSKAAYVQGISAAFAQLNISASLDTSFIPKHPFFASQWLTFHISVGT